MKKRVKIIAVILITVLAQSQIIYPSISGAIQSSDSYTLRPVSTQSVLTGPHQLILSGLHLPKTTATYSIEHTIALIARYEQLLASANTANERAAILQTIDDLQQRLGLASISFTKYTAGLIEKLESLVNHTSTEDERDAFLDTIKILEQRLDLPITYFAGHALLLTERFETLLSRTKTQTLQTAIAQIVNNLKQKLGFTEELSSPFHFNEPHEELSIRIVKKIVEKKGVVNGNHAEKRLNAAVETLQGKRLLFPRRALKTGLKNGTRVSFIGFGRHDEKTGEFIDLDPQMLMPYAVIKDLEPEDEDAEYITKLKQAIKDLMPEDEDPENVVALEDARVLERDHTTCIYVTVVVKDKNIRHGSRNYSAVTTISSDRLAEIAEQREDMSEQDRSKYRASWPLTRLTRIISDDDIENALPDEYKGQNDKNFTPTGDQSYGFIRKDGKHDKRRELLLLKYIKGKWQFFRKYMHVLTGWMGASSFVAGMQEKEGEPCLDFTTMHHADDWPNGVIKKYYDLWLLISDRKTEHESSTVVPLFSPDIDVAFEADGQGWVPGTIYSCGAILTEYNEDEGKYVFDVYYSGSDEKLLLVTITLYLEFTDKSLAKNMQFVKIDEILLKQMQECEKIAAKIEPIQTNSSLIDDTGHNLATQQLINRAA